MSIAGSVPTDKSPMPASGLLALERIPAEAHEDPDLRADPLERFWVIDSASDEVVATVYATSRDSEAQSRERALAMVAAPDLKAAIEQLLDACLVTNTATGSRVCIVCGGQAPAVDQGEPVFTHAAGCPTFPAMRAFEKAEGR